MMTFVTVETRPAGVEQTVNMENLVRCYRDRHALVLSLADGSSLTVEEGAKGYDTVIGVLEGNVIR